MVQRLFNIGKWTTLEEGQSYLLPTDQEDKLRQVRLDVNAPGRVQLFILDSTEERVQFLACVEGRDTVEFVGEGTLRLTAEGGPVEVYTVDGDDISIEIVAPVVFTKIMERRRRSPELEYIVNQMNFNMERRLAQQADDLRRLLANRESARAALDAARGVPGGLGAEPLPDNQSGTSDPSSAGADGGSDGQPER